MDAKNYRLQQLFSGTQQFLIPIYQRQYSWERRDWQALWDDIIEVYDDGGEDVHFLGSIVSKPHVSSAGGISSFVVIDGQQRLTTLTLLIAALRDAFAERSEPRNTTADKLQNLYLTNQYGQGEERYKVVPTKADQDLYFSVIDRKTPQLSGQDNIVSAYQFFVKALNSGHLTGEPLSLSRLEQVILGRFEVVSITLGADDNDYRVFESLNARGRPLSQTDLLRNYFLMRFDGDRQSHVYNEYLLPMTQALESVPTAKSDTMFQYALQRQGIYVRDRDVYFQWKRRCDPLTLDALDATINEIQFDCENYLRIQDPSREPDERVRKRLERLQRLGIYTPTPFLLNVYRWYRSNHINTEGMVTILGYVESYLVRRLISGIPNNALNRIFIRLHDQIKPDSDFVAATHEALSQPGLRWPSDVDFTHGLTTYSLYKDTRPDQRRLILELLELSFGHKEPPILATATIEHIMPQTLTGAWREMLGPLADQIHARLVHTLGNLTLTGYNGELSNSPFSQKKELLAKSHFSLSVVPSQARKWDEEEIARRAGSLAHRALKIWPSPLTV